MLSLVLSASLVMMNSIDWPGVAMSEVCRNDDTCMYISERSVCSRDSRPQALKHGFTISGAARS